MVGARNLRCLIAGALLALSGCSWLGARGRDLGDIVRVEGSFGYGLQANVTATELLHAGVGSSRRWTGGWAYGFHTTERRSEDFIPVTLVTSILHPDAEALHVLKIGKSSENLRHRCPYVAPVTLDGGTIRKPEMQFWNVEVGVMFLLVGAQVGINAGEIVDFIVGLVGFDLAGDDDEDGRARRRLWESSSPPLISER